MLLDREKTFPLILSTMEEHDVPLTHRPYGDPETGVVYLPIGFKDGDINYGKYALGIDVAIRGTAKILKNASARMDAKIDATSHIKDPEGFSGIFDLEDKRDFQIQKFGYLNWLLLQYREQEVVKSLQQASRRLSLLTSWSAFQGHPPEDDLAPELAIANVRVVGNYLREHVRVLPFLPVAQDVADLSGNSLPQNDSELATFAQWVNIKKWDPAKAVLGQMQNQIKSALETHADPNLCCPRPSKKAA